VSLERLDADLGRWKDAGLIAPEVAERIRAFEAARDEPGRLSWPVWIAIGFGAVLLAAAVLLFVEANWDELSPAARFALVLVLVVGFHAAGAFTAERFGALATALHAVGTAALGAGIFLSGQIFHLQEHWPGGFMLWAAGAWLGVWLLRDWPQLAFAAALTPVWLVGEWIEATPRSEASARIAVAGVLLLALTYFSAPARAKPSPERRVLLWLGGIAVLPAAAFAAAIERSDGISAATWALGWSVALFAPLALAWRLHGRDAWTNAVSALWVVLLVSVGAHGESAPLAGTAIYLVYALGSLGMIAWGMHDARPERVNLGMIGFALTLVAYYFGNVFDKLGRAASLFVLGVLFLAAGFALERARRRLIARIAEEAR
jgi:uncharacterized membrane protein